MAVAAFIVSALVVVCVSVSSLVFRSYGAGAAASIAGLLGGLLARGHGSRPVPGWLHSRGFAFGLPGMSRPQAQVPSGVGHWDCGARGRDGGWRPHVARLREAPGAVSRNLSACVRCLATRLRDKARLRPLGAFRGRPNGSVWTTPAGISRMERFERQGRCAIALVAASLGSANHSCLNRRTVCECAGLRSYSNQLRRRIRF